MKAFAPMVPAVLFAANTVALAPIVVDISSLTPSVCEPLTFGWSEGTPPYQLTISHVLSNGFFQAVERLGTQNVTSITWVVNIVPVPGGESLTLNVADAVGDFGQSSSFEIQDSTNRSCIPPLIVYTPPTGTVCQELTLDWSGGTPPYRVEVAQSFPDNTTVGIRTFSPRTSRNLNWFVDITLTGGDTFFVNVIDGVGTLHQSSNFAIRDSPDHSCIPVVSDPASTTSSAPVGSTSKSGLISEGKILGIGFGLLAALVLFAIWRIYILRTRRRRSASHEDSENLGLDQKIPLSPIQKHFK